MEAVTVDASVWVAAADPSDDRNAISRAFFLEAAQKGVGVNVPAFAAVEVACALARRTGDPYEAREMTEAMLAGPEVTVVPADTAFLARAVVMGTNALLRGADALYAVTAAVTDSVLVSWDAEHVARAAAMTPDAWSAGATASDC